MCQRASSCRCVVCRCKNQCVLTTPIHTLASLLAGIVSGVTKQPGHSLTHNRRLEPAAGKEAACIDLQLSHFRGGTRRKPAFASIARCVVQLQKKVLCLIAN